MALLDDIAAEVWSKIECKPLSGDPENWYKCLAAMDRRDYVPLQYKPGFLKYQETYFRDVYEGFRDISMVLYRGGKPVGIWPVCVYRKDGKTVFCTAESALLGPLFPFLPKAEGQRSVIEHCLEVLLDAPDAGELLCAETVTERGGSQWIRKLMEHGGVAQGPKWEVFTDLDLSQEEIQSRIRRTNKYSVARGQDEYDIELYDETSPDLEERFEEFHRMHSEVAGRETRSQATWDAQLDIIRESSAEKGRSFLVFIRDKESKQLAGSALFDTNPQTGIYCVAAYDRSRFSKPVGHIVQAVAMERMREKGVRWYEIGERNYPADPGAYDKLVDIGHYKEGFATHFWPKVFVKIDRESFRSHILK